MNGIAKKVTRLGREGRDDDMIPHDLLRKKAELLRAGTIVLDRNLALPFPLSRSSAGPEVGTRNILLDLWGSTHPSDHPMRVKLKASRGRGTSSFLLTRKDDPGTGAGEGLVIMRGSELFLTDVVPIRTPIHAPDQAFINIDAGCRYRCLFCTSYDLPRYRRKDNEWWISTIRAQAAAGAIRSIAITSGIPGSIEDSISDFIQIIKGVADLGLPIGVEPYVESVHQLQSLRDAGASELKLNIQSWDPEIFHRICPGLDRDHIQLMLSEGVRIFGRNRVCSNMIMGFGETDKTIIEGIRHLASMGVAVHLRHLHVNPGNRERLREAVAVEPMDLDRWIGLRNHQQSIFREFGIDVSGFRTMCFPCGGCDLDP